MDFDLSLSSFAPAIEAIGKAGLPLLEQGLTAALSTAATATTGPFGLLVSPILNTIWPAVNSALNLPADAAPATTAATINADPAGAQAKLAAVQEQHAYALQAAKQASDATFGMAQEIDRTNLTQDQEQDQINAKAADSASWFVYGYRPAIVWGLGALTVLYGMLAALGWFIRGLTGHDWGTPPSLPWYIWLGLFSLLGIVSVLRSYDKANGTAALPPAAPAAMRGR